MSMNDLLLPQVQHEASHFAGLGLKDLNGESHELFIGEDITDETDFIGEGIPDGTDFQES